MSETIVQPLLENTIDEPVTFNRRDKLLLILTSLIAISLFWIGARTFHIPTYPHFSISLLQQDSALVALVVTVVLYAASVLIGSLIAGVVRADAGLFCGAIGLAALSTRGGPMRFTLFAGSGPKTFLMLVVEAALLAAMTAGGYFIQQALINVRLLRHDPGNVPMVRSTIEQRLLGLAVNIIVIAVVTVLLGQSDRKVQVLASVGIAACFGTMAANSIASDNPSIWLVIAPMIVAVAGYLLTYSNGAVGWQIGQVNGMFAPLARPLPLDYASFGVAGALLGNWYHPGKRSA